MSNKINTAFEVDPGNRQPWTVKSLDFVQDNVKTLAVALAKTFLYDAPTSPYILYGCEKVLSSTASTYNINAGYIFVQPDYDVCYLNASGPLILSGTDVAVCTKSISYDATADPLTFEDGFPRNVHQHINYKVTAGPSGSGDFDFDDMLNVQNTMFRKPSPIEVGSSATTVTWATGFTQTSSLLPLNFWKDNAGFVYIQGSAKATSTEVLYSEIFTLPVGYRPTLESELKFCACDLVNTEIFKDIIIFAADGTVNISPPTINHKYSVNIMFYAG